MIGKGKDDDDERMPVAHTHIIFYALYSTYIQICTYFVLFYEEINFC